MQKISKLTFKKEYPYLFQLVGNSMEIKLSEYELMELVDNKEELFRCSLESLDINKTKNIQIMLINFFTDECNEAELLKMQERVDLFYDNLADEVIIMWCTTANKYNINKQNAEVFFVKPTEA
jgi:hypothetical protein